MQQKNRSSSRGRWTVLAMVVFGVIAGTIAVTYWNNVARRAQQVREASRQERAGEAAGSVAFDQKQADRELKELHQSYLEQREDHLDRVLASAYRLVERYPRYAPARVELGQMLIDAARLEDAYEQLALALELDPQQPEVRRLAGDIALMVGRYVEAAGHYSTAISLDPRDAQYRLHLAQAYMKQNELEKARDAVLEALRIDSSLHQGYAALSDVYAQQNKATLALTQIDRAIEHTPLAERPTQVIYIRRKAHLLRRDNRPEDALLTLQSLLVAEKRQREVVEEMAVCWALLDQPEKGAALFDAAVLAKPDDWRLRAKAAEWWLKAGDTRKAKQHLLQLELLDADLPVLAKLREQLAAAGG